MAAELLPFSPPRRRITLGDGASSHDGGEPTAFEQFRALGPRFFPWQEVDRGGPKPDKIPMRADGESFGSSTDPTAWTDLRSAQCTAITEGLAGVGVALGRLDDGRWLAGVDLDNCRDPETGAIEPWATPIVQKMASYTEVSPSGCGLKIFAVCDDKPKIARHQVAPDYADGGGDRKIEVYTEGRFFTLTGRRFHDAPDSLNTAGAAFQTVADDVAKIARQRGEKVSSGQDAGTAYAGEPDEQQNIDSYRRTLRGQFKHKKVAVEGESGDEWTYKTILLGRDYALSEDMVFDILTEDDGWNDHCQPPWDLDVLRGKVASSFRNAKNPWGCRARPPGAPEGCPPASAPANDDGNDGGGLDEIDAAVEAQSKGEPSDARVKNYLASFMTVDQVLSRPPREFIIEGLILERSSHNWCGGPGSYKSWVLLQLAYALASGASEVLGYPINRACRVVYFDAENDGLNDRHEAMIERYGRPPAGELLIQPGPALLASDEKFALMLAALKIIRPGVVIVDTKAKSTVGLNENYASDMAQVWARVDRIKTELGAAVITATHTNKSGAQRGSNADEGDVDALFVQTKTGKGTVKLHVEKLRGAPAPEKDAELYAVDTGPGITFNAPSPDEMTPGKQRDQQDEAAKARDLRAKAELVKRQADNRAREKETAAAMWTALMEFEELDASEAYDHSRPPLPVPIKDLVETVAPRMRLNPKAVRERVNRAVAPGQPYADCVVDTTERGRVMTLRIPEDFRPASDHPPKE